MTSLKQLIRPASELQAEVERLRVELDEERRMKDRYSSELKDMEEQARHAWNVVNNERLRSKQLDEEARAAVEATINDTDRERSQLLAEMQKMKQDSARAEASSQAAQASASRAEATADVESVKARQAEATADVESAKARHAQKRATRAEARADHLASELQQVSERLVDFEDRAAAADRELARMRDDLAGARLKQDRYAAQEQILQSELDEFREEQSQVTTAQERVRAVLQSTGSGHFQARALETLYRHGLVGATEEETRRVLLEGGAQHFFEMLVLTRASPTQRDKLFEYRW
jgi:chromosome segregation ATPase